MPEMPRIVYGPFGDDQPDPWASDEARAHAGAAMIELQPAERNQMARLQHARSQLGQEVDRGVLNPREADMLGGLINQRLQPLMFRASQIPHIRNALGVAQLMREMAHEETIRQEGAAFRARTLAQRFATHPHPITNEPIAMFEDRPGHWAPLPAGIQGGLARRNPAEAAREAREERELATIRREARTEWTRREDYNPDDEEGEAAFIARAERIHRMSRERSRPGADDPEPPMWRIVGPLGMRLPSQAWLNWHRRRAAAGARPGGAPGAAPGDGGAAPGEGPPPPVGIPPELVERTGQRLQELMDPVTSRIHFRLPGHEEARARQERLRSYIERRLRGVTEPHENRQASADHDWLRRFAALPLPDFQLGAPSPSGPLNPMTPGFTSRPLPAMEPEARPHAEREAEWRRFTSRPMPED